MTQKNLFSEMQTPAIKNCSRCGRKCRCAEKESTAKYMRRGTVASGEFCANCLMTHFLKNFDLGPRQAMGADEFDKTFPDALRLPHIQEQMNKIASFGDGPAGEVDWEVVVAQWHLEFPRSGGRGAGKRR
jgi:hypothetical protein